jgi:hypothetical protein
MEHHFDEDEMGIETNEYPDPEYTPRFAWLSVRNATPPPHTIESPRDSTEQSASDDASGNNSPPEDQIYPELEEGRDANGLSRDPDFQYQDDSDE